jgi:hypothetical protein
MTTGRINQVFRSSERPFARVPPTREPFTSQANRTEVRRFARLLSLSLEPSRAALARRSRGEPRSSHHTSRDDYPTRLDFL